MKKHHLLLPVAAPVAQPVDDAGMTKTVVSVVVEHTGYPADFIELDQDLEGELGIDTVKQAEIMADIRDRFDLPIDEDFVLSDHPTLNHMIGYIQRMKGQSPSSAPPNEPAPAPEPLVEAPTPTESTPSPPAVQGSSPEIEDVLVSVVVSHTGYPADFIELDQDLEGELGIDTVKQAEIMAEIRDRFRLPLDEDFVLADHPTLNHFTAYIVKMQGGAEPTTTVATPEAEPSVAPQESDDHPGSHQAGTRRWQVEIEACPGIASPLNVSGTVVVSDDGWGIAEAFCQRMGSTASMLFVLALRVAFGMLPDTKVGAPFTEPTQNNRSTWHGLLTNSRALRLGAWSTWLHSNWPPRSGWKMPIRRPKLRSLAMVGLVCSRNWVGECRPTTQVSSPL